MSGGWWKRRKKRNEIVSVNKCFEENHKGLVKKEDDFMESDASKQRVRKGSLKRW